MFIENVIKIIQSNKKTIIFTVGAAVAGAVGTLFVEKEKNERVIKEEKEKSYDHGLRDGVKHAKDAEIQVTGELLLAWIYMAYYMAKADGRFSAKEKKYVDKKVNEMLEEKNVSDEVKKEIKNISNSKELSFDKAKDYLNLIPLHYVEEIVADMLELAKIDWNYSEKESRVISEIEDYISSRKLYADSNKTSFDLINNKEAYFDYIVDKKIEEATNDYSLKMRMLDRSFCNKTKLDTGDVKILFLAVCLQCSRVLITNYITKQEKAGEGKREKTLHDIQDKVLNIFNTNEKEKCARYYAPLKQIVSTTGVPYDAQKYLKGDNLGLFKGANHRFATLGHDPIIGLLVGTVNIMTNTITTVENDGHIPLTHHVGYTSDYKKPTIMKEPASFLEAISRVTERSEEDITPLAASFIKQLIHVASDMYTPAGINLPAANLVLSNESVEALTKFISTGDVIKTASSAVAATLINKLVAMLYGCYLMSINEDLNMNINVVKLKKIVLYSDSIAVGSSIIQGVIQNNMKCLDLGGMIVLVYRLFNDVDFIYKVKREFISAGLGE